MKRTIDILGLLLVALFTTACSGGGDDGENTPVTPDQPPVLTFYVYAPERPMMTRANEVNATDEENAIHNMQIWVFEKGTNTLVGYLAPTSFPTTAEGQVYQMNVSKEFANAATKPHVDVYVLANVTSNNCGLNFDEHTTKSTLETAVLEGNYFGVSSPQKGVPEGGLPMTGVLRDKAIGGENPVLRVEDGGSMAKVRLLRMVSKVRYVFCKGVGSATLPINGITIDQGLIPTTEYLFLTDKNYSDYVSSVTSLITATEITDIKECGNPQKYDINTITPSLTAQAYENLIDLGVKGDAEHHIDADLTLAGPFYFKESDKKLSGKIFYKPPGGTATNIGYSMKADDANSSFTRNHSWIVYAYYEGLSGMQVIVVDVTPWEEKDENHSVYNW